MFSLTNTFITIDELVDSPIWAPGAAPSKRTIHTWVRSLGMPRHKCGRLTWYCETEIYHFLLNHFRCPRRRRAQILSFAKTLRCPELITFQRLRESLIWTAEAAPSQRTLRSWIATDAIPYFRIGHTLYFNANIVRYCLGSAFDAAPEADAA